MSRFVYSPIIIRKDKRKLVNSTTNAPSTSRYFSIDNRQKYAPVRVTKMYGIAKGYYNYSPSSSSNLSYDYSPETYQSRYSDYAPSTYRSLFTDYSPLTYRLVDIKEKSAPFTDYKLFYRYAPLQEDVEFYKPVLVSRFKPQPLVITNSKSLRDYYDYILGLIAILE
jgi:hypothetical protein